MIIYLLKFMLCSATLLLFYKAVLEREKLLRFNRFYLLGSLVLSVVIPLIPLEILFQNPVFPHTPAAFAESTLDGPYTYPVQLLPHPDTVVDFSWLTVMGILYLTVSVWTLVRFGKNLLMLRRRVLSQATNKHEGLNLILLDAPAVPHSFLNYVFVSKADYLDGTLEREILDHERAHAQQLHSLDVLFIEILKVIFWFNPALYFYRNAMAMNHEFLADASVTRDLGDISSYQHLLLQKSASPMHLPFISKFNYSFIKKRFVMMHKQTSPVRAALAQGSVLPLLAIAFFAFSDLTMAQIAPPPPPMEISPSSISPELVKEYNELIIKYIERSETGFLTLRNPSLADGTRMIALQESMSKAQADTLTFQVYNPKPSPKQKPSVADFEKYKNPNVYGVWLDDRKISNSKLNSFKADDIVQIFVSRVYANAQPKTGYKYKYQVELMTEPHYEAYIKEVTERASTNPRFMLLKRNKPKS